MANEQVDRIAQAVLSGAPTDAPAQAPVPAPAASEKPTAQEQAVEQTAPSASEAEAILYDISVGGSKRKMSPEQISGVLERYAALNGEVGEMSDVLSFAKQMLGSSGRSPKDLVKFLQEAVTSYQKGAQPAQPAQQPTQGDDDIEAQLKAWQEKNAIDELPPGLVDTLKSTKTMQQQLQAMTAMLQQVLAAGRDAAVGGEAAYGQAQAEKKQVIQQKIVNNLNMAQQKLGLPDEAAQDFFTFAGERGFTMEDFLNPDLTGRVMTDFKNAMNSPEMERLRQMAQKRQAFSGSLGATPTQGGEAPKPGNGDPMLDRLVNKAMGQA